MQPCIRALPRQSKANWCSLSIWIGTLWLGNVVVVRSQTACKFSMQIALPIVQFIFCVQCIGLEGLVSGVHTEVCLSVHPGLVCHMSCQ